MKFENRLDKLSKTVTWITAILLTVPCLIVLFEEPAVASILCILFPAIFLISWGLHPQYYLVENGKLIIVRPFSKLELRLQDFNKIEPVDKAITRGSIRLFGSGGFFGFFGLFHNKTLGRYRMYVTDRNKLILLRGDKDCRLISPLNREACLKALIEEKAKCE